MTDVSSAAADTDNDLRIRLGKLCGMLGSEHVGERANARDAMEQLLGRAGLSWAWLADIVSRGTLPDVEREMVLAGLLARRLHGGLDHEWAMTAVERKFVREIASRCQRDLCGTDTNSIKRAIGFADEALRRADAAASKRNLRS